MRNLFAKLESLHLKKYYFQSAIIFLTVMLRNYVSSRNGGVLGIVFNYSLEGKTPGRSHLRRGDHIYPRAITSCPGHALCLTWQVKCTRPGDHIHAWWRELKRFARYCNSWHQARM